MSTRQIGAIAEKRAADYLKKEGFKLVMQNYSTKLGEIDLIMTKKGVYHFIEVKSGSSFDPVYNLTALKLRKIIKTVYAYIKEHHITDAYCIDALIVRDKEIEYIPNITF